MSNSSVLHFSPQKAHFLAQVVSCVAFAAILFAGCAPLVGPDFPTSKDPSSSKAEQNPQRASAQRGTSSESRPIENVEQADDEEFEFAAAVASLGSRLAPNLLQGRPEGSNLVFSPLGIHAVLSALASGAGDSSRTGLTQLLGLPVNDRFPLQSRYQLGAVRKISGLGLQLRFDCAQQLKLETDWITSLSRDFQASFERQDFLNDSRGSTALIDAWFRGKTRGRIQSVYGADVLPRTSSLVVSSVLTFRMNWMQRFSLLETGPRSFTLEGGQRVLVPTMRAEKLPILVGRLHHSRTDSSMGVGVPGPLWVAIPFSGETTFLLLGLPGVVGELPVLERQLSEPGVRAIFERMDGGNHEVLLPKIDWISPTFSLSSEIQKLEGGSELRHLDLSRAGLSGRFDLSSLVQRVAVRWDEQGADLAAATSLSGVGIGLATVKPIAFDHPFVFAVVSRDTGLILFQGRMSDPRTFSR